MMSALKPSPRLLGPAFFLSCVAVAGALTPVNDSFTGTSINAANWQAPVVERDGSLSQSGSLRYSSATAGGDTSAYLPAVNLPLYSDSWEVVLDVTNTATPSVVNQVVSTGIGIFNVADQSDSVSVELYASTSNTLPLRRGFKAALDNDGTETNANDTLNLPGQTAGSLRVQYNATTHVLSTYYDSDGSGNGFLWTLIASYGIGGAGGANGSVDWGLSPDSELAVAVYGFSSGMTVTSGQVTMDNFTATSSYTVTRVTVGKSIDYVQTSASNVAVNPTPPSPDYGGPYGFAVNVEGDHVSALTATPVVTGPFTNADSGFHNQGKLVYNSGDATWRYGSPGNDWGSPTLSDLESHYGSGTYTVTVGGASIPLVLTGDIYPNVPTLTLSGGAWSGGKYYIDPAAALTITTNTYTAYGTHAEDAIQIGVDGVDENLVFASSSPSTSSLSLQVAANTLTPGQEYGGGSAFIAVSSVNSAALAGSLNAAFYQKGTEFSLVAQTVQKAWRQANFGTTANTGTAADTADFDHDGVTNLMEWGLNLNPKVPDNLPTTVARNGANIEYTYTRNVGAKNAGATFTVEWSDTLLSNSWSNAGVTEQVLSDDGTAQQVKATLPAGSAGHRFVHLKVTAPP